MMIKKFVFAAIAGAVIGGVAHAKPEGGLFRGSEASVEGREWAEERRSEKASEKLEAISEKREGIRGEVGDEGPRIAFPPVSEESPDVTLSAVPLPAAGFFLLAGLGGLVLLRRRG